MAYFNRDTSNRGGRDNRGGGRGFGGGGRSSFGGRDSGRRDDKRSLSFQDGPREMFKTVCSNCGKECEVPFKPTTGKPVYCSDCFEKMGGRNSDGPRSETNDRSERRDRPSFDRHQSSSVDNNKQLNELNAKLEAISVKIEKIIALLTPKTEEKIIEVAVEEAKPLKTPKVKRVKIVK